ncbi:MAG: cupin domain-containing protein [Pseudomonadota bacterium]
MDTSAALRDFFHPIDPAEIAGSVADARRLFRMTDRASAFARLLPWTTLGTLITADALRKGYVTIARQGRSLPLEMVGASAGGLAPEAIQALCDQGASLVLNQVDKQVPAIAAMNAMVERYLRCDTHTNAYASFNRESAFKAHFDPHNVLILQLQGRKRWWCYGQKVRFPLKGQTFSTLEELPPAEWEGVLKPGDMLYVPRGDVHRAMVEGPHSLHLTVTMIPPTGADVMAWLGRKMQHEDIGRAYLPVLGDAEDRRAHQAELRAAFHRLVDTLDIGAFLADADRERTPCRPFSLGLSQAIGPDTVVQPALRRRVSLAGPEAKHGALPDGERAVLALLLAEDALTLRQLADTLPGFDTHAAVESLARKTLVFLSPDI